MKQVYTSQDRFYIYHLKNLLEAEGIECLIKNDTLSSLAGELPMTVVWPELWVIDSIYSLKAKGIITDSKKESSTGKNWICKNCREEHSSQFMECWNCQSIKAF